ncbi:MAG: hypothetical protein NC453_14330 [Muribaculum sp.]|nr:hypothetical protein [Muribaculum sp.]
MTIEERDTARAIQTIARELKKGATPAPIDWEARKWEMAKELYIGWCNHPDGMVRREAKTIHGRSECISMADEFISVYKSQTNKTE